MVNYFKFLNVRQIQFFPGDGFNLLKTGSNTNKTPNNFDASDKLIGSTASVSEMGRFHHESWYYMLLDKQY